MGDSHKLNFTLEKYVQESRLALAALEDIWPYDGSQPAEAFLKKVTNIFLANKVEEEIFTRLLVVKKLEGEARQMFDTFIPNKISELVEILCHRFPEKQKQRAFQDIKFQLMTFGFCEMSEDEFEKYFDDITKLKYYAPAASLESSKSEVVTEPKDKTNPPEIKPKLTNKKKRCIHQVSGKADNSALYFEPSMFTESSVSKTNSAEPSEYFESALFQEPSVSHDFEVYPKSLGTLTSETIKSTVPEHAAISFNVNKETVPCIEFKVCNASAVNPSISLPISREHICDSECKFLLDYIACESSLTASEKSNACFENHFKSDSRPFDRLTVKADDDCKKSTSHIKLVISFRRKLKGNRIVNVPPTTVLANRCHKYKSIVNRPARWRLKSLVHNNP